MYLTEEQTAFVDSIRKMVERHIAPIAAEIDETDRFPEELVPIFGDMGLLQQWVLENNRDLGMSFEIVPVVPSKETREVVAPYLDRK